MTRAAVLRRDPSGLGVPEAKFLAMKIRLMYVKLINKLT